MKRRKIIATFVAIIMSITLTAEMPLIVRAATSNEIIRQSEKEKQAAEENKATLKKGLTDVKALLQKLESAKKDLQAYITELDGNLNTINENIDLLTKEIEVKEKELEQTKLELEDAIWRGQEQYALMKKRIQFIYEKSRNSNVEMILDSKSLTDFLNRAEFVNKLSEYDRNMLNEFVKNAQEIADIKALLEKEQAELEASKKDLKNEQDALETLISAKQDEIEVYENDIDNKEAAIKEYEAEIAQQNEIIKALEQTIAEERRKLAEKNGKLRTYDGGKFKFPAPSYTRISDDYGNRMHPILGVQKFHNGVDLAAPSGSPILAAYDGDVIAAAYSSSMGNYIMLDHGDGLYTIYMHASALYVSKGQTVSKGDKIAAVGSTGRSTGPHLHFSVRENGDYVSPWKYLK